MNEGISNGKILILRVAGKIPGDSQRELSIVGKEHTKRAISETMPWFDKKGKSQILKIKHYD